MFRVQNYLLTYFSVRELKSVKQTYILKSSEESRDKGS